VNHLYLPRIRERTVYVGDIRRGFCNMWQDRTDKGRDVLTVAWGKHIKILGVVNYTRNSITHVRPRAMRNQYLRYTRLTNYVFAQHRM